MTTTLERLTAGAAHDPDILVPTTYSTLLRVVEGLCPCGAVASVRDGRFTSHEPRSTWDADGRRRSVIRDATGVGWTCRYSGRTVTLAAALERDTVLTPAEQHVRDATERRLRAGVTNTAPAGYALPKPVADLLALAGANGWQTQQAWAPYDDGFRLSVRVSRALNWQYDLAYFVAPGVARRTRFGMCVTPNRRGPHDTPSLKAVTAVIRANPVTIKEARDAG